MHRLRAGRGLGVEVTRHVAAEQRHQGVPRLWLCVHELLGARVLARRAALDHVGGQREGRPGETDQRQVRRQRGARGTHRLHHKGQRFGGIHLPQPFDVSRGLQGIVQHRPVAGAEFELHAHRFENQQDVGENDGRVDAQALDGVHRYLGGQVRRFAQFEERHLRAHLPV